MIKRPGDYPPIREDGILTEAQSEFISRSLKKAQRAPIDMREFKDLYKDVDKDLEMVQRFKTLFEQQNAESPDSKKERELKKLADAFEVLLANQIELYYWMGDEVEIIAASEFDDIVNKVDVIAEFQTNTGEFSYLGMGIDVTFSKKSLEKKLVQIKDLIDNGNMTKVKYFLSEHQRGELRNVPLAIVSADNESLNGLIALSNQRDRLLESRAKSSLPDADYSRKIKELNKQLLEHPFQFELLEQMILQLQTFAAYANYKDQPQMVQRYNVVLEKLKGIYRAKLKLRGQVLKEGKDIKPPENIAQLLRDYFRTQ